MTTQQCSDPEPAKFIQSMDYPDLVMTLKDYNKHDKTQILVNKKDSNYEEYQKWTIPKDEGTIVAQATTNRGMTIAGKPENDMTVQNDTLTGSNRQSWRILKRPGGAVTISPVDSTDFGLTLQGGIDEPGTAVILTAIPGSGPEGKQLWKFGN